jgi:hypothetical protein
MDIHLFPRDGHMADDNEIAERKKKVEAERAKLLKEMAEDTKAIAEIKKLSKDAKDTEE